MQSPFQGLSRLFTWAGLRIPAIALLLLAPGGAGLISPIWAQTEPEGMEVLTRGPVHEAFAATINFKATEGLIAPQAPPEAIQEIPPEQRPEGDKVTWIPGYWAWDDETIGFLWVSGIWRNLPPGRQWIPGYWWDSAQGYQWISGYWADAESDEVEYLSEPPASLEAGPNVAAPSRSHTWIPGTWRWTDSRYAWQPGYWYEAQPDWVWVPPYYNWAPQGWLFVDGYYDYAVPRRGLVFAPVRFSAGYASRPDYFYRPTTVISLTVFSNHLFLRPRNHHYYFGDYYAPKYRRSGYFPSFNYYSGGYGYDPIYSHERWRHRDDDRWERRRKEDFSYYRDNKSARPPHTLAAMGEFLSRPDRNRRVESDFAPRLDQLAERRDSPIRLRRLGEAEQKTFARRSQEIRKFGDQRRNLTGRAAPPSGQRNKQDAAKRKPDEGKPVKVKMPKSPVMARATEGKNRPPSRPNVPADRKQPEKGNDRDTGRGTPKGEQGSDSRADPVDSRRGGRVKEPKQRPNADRKEPPIKDTPKVEPNDPARARAKSDSRKPGNREAKPKREARPQPRENSRPPGRKSEPAPPPKRATQEKKEQKSQAESRRESPSPPRKEPKASPRPQPTKAPSPASKKQKKDEAKPRPEKEKKKGGKD